MSKITLLGMKLAAPEIIGDVVKGLLKDNPQILELLTSQENVEQFRNLIVEKAQQAMKIVADARSGQVSQSIHDYNNHEIRVFDGQKITVAIKAPGLSRGMGVIVDREGKICFAGDIYGENQKVSSMLQEDFRTAFSACVTQAFLDILGYETVISQPTIIKTNSSGSEKLFIQVQGDRR